MKRLRSTSNCCVKKGFLCLSHGLQPNMRMCKSLDRDILPRDVISRKLSVPNAERIFFIRHALRAGFTIEEIFNLTKIDRWFLVQIKEIVDFEEELAGAKN